MAVDEPGGIALPRMRDARAREILGRARTPASDPLALALRAAKLGAPVVVLAHTPADRRRLARAVHAIAGRPGPLLVGAMAYAEVPVSGTLLVDVGVMGPGAEMVVESLVDDAEPWLLIGAPTIDDVPAAIRASAGSLVLQLSPIDDGAIHTVARDALVALGAPAGETPELEQEFADWLETRADVRDLAALQTLLRLSLATASPGESIGLRHLTCAATTVPPVGATAPSEPPPSGPTAARLEYVLAELAHELRNPLVTLKTVADHLDELAADEELRSRFTALARDAVARMDDLLDNLVSYGRLAAPTRRAVALGEVLETAVRDAEPALLARRLSVRALAGTASCLSDPLHLGFALKNLLLGIAQTAAPDGEVVVDASMNGVVRVRFATDADAATLQSLLAPSETHALYDPTYQPLPFSLARAVLETVGGTVDVVRAGEEGTALDVHLPVSDDAV